MHGAVARPLALALGDLRAMLTVERLITMSCISNTIGGPLVGNALWTGISLADLLTKTAPIPGARTLMARGADGYFATLPLDLARLPDALVAFAMDGALLPREHGFPARLLVPGRYGFKSVKWLEELEVLTTSPLGYWEERGWDAAGVIRTESRFDVPMDHGEVSSPFVAAGVAWAGTRGIARVEVSTDDGQSWHVAELEATADALSWRRWKTTLSLPPGVHPLTVRAADGAGRLQDAMYRPPRRGDRGEIAPSWWDCGSGFVTAKMPARAGGGRSYTERDLMQRTLIRGADRAGGAQCTCHRSASSRCAR